MPVQFSTDDLRTPESLERVLRQFESALRPPTPTPTMPTLAQLASALLPLIRDQLQAPGGFPLNLTGLLPGSGGGVDIEVTHADRLALYTPPAVPLGTGLFETDRTVRYLVYNSAGTLVWRYSSGVYKAALASRPSDLTTNDSGFRFINTNTDQNTEYVWDGTEWWTIGGYLQQVVDAANNASTIIHALRHTAAGPAAGMGATLQAELGAAGAEVPVFQQQVYYTGGTANVYLDFYLLSGSALTFLMRLAYTGDLGIIGDLFWQSGTANTGQLAHNNSAARIYTFADADGNITYQTVALANNNFVFGGGGALVKDAGFAVVPIANGGTNANTAATARTSLDVAQRQTVGGSGAGTYVVAKITALGADGSITITAEGTISSFTAPT